MKIEIEKIVGTAGEQNWCQVHSFSPQEEEKKQKWGQLIAIFAFKAKKENLETTSFGTEIIQRFHELYYSGTGTVLANLRNAYSQIQEEFQEQIELQIDAGVIINETKPIFYLVSKNCETKLWRGKKLHNLFSPDQSIKTLSGWLKNKDIIVLGTNQFFAHLAAGALTLALQKENLEAIKEDLATSVGACQDNSLFAAAVILLDGQPEVNAEKEFENPPINQPKVKNYFQKQASKLKDFIVQRTQIGHKRKVNLVFALILIFALVASIVLGWQKRTHQTYQNQEKKVLDRVSAQFDQASSLMESNRSQAQEILLLAQKDLEAYLQQNSQADAKSENIISMQKKIQETLENALKEYRSEKAEVFYDFVLLKQGFFGQFMALADEELVVLDPTQAIVLQLSLSTKQGKIMAGGEKLKSSKGLGKITDFVFVQTQDKLLLIKADNGKISGEKEIKDFLPVQATTAFGSAAYLLGKNQIYKFIALDNEISDKRDYLIKPDEQLNQAVGLTIDGSVWVLLDSGKIIKYTQGREDNFALMGLDKPFVEPTSLFTCADCENLYILDRKNTRVVVIDKKGQFQGSYVWPGIAGVSDLVVSEKEKKILLLSGARIYELSLK